MVEENVEAEVAKLDERYGRLRIVQPRQERAVAESLRRLGQLTAVVANKQGEAIVLVDGFKRLRAARELGVPTLRVRVVELAVPAAIAAMASLNGANRPLLDLEEAMIVKALCREHGLNQVEVAKLLGRDKSWVCRRLALVERLSSEVLDDMRVGLVPLTVAREIARLPRGNQAAVATAVHRHELTTREAVALVGLFERAGSPGQQRALLEAPRKTLEAQARPAPPPPYDPRLSPETNKLRQRLVVTLTTVTEMLGRVEQARPARWTEVERALIEPVVTQLESGCTLLIAALGAVVTTKEGSNANAA